MPFIFSLLFSCTRSLRELGIQLYVVAYWDWDVDAALMQKVAYLSELLPVSAVSATVSD